MLGKGKRRSIMEEIAKELSSRLGVGEEEALEKLNNIKANTTIFNSKFIDMLATNEKFIEALCRNEKLIDALARKLDFNLTRRLILASGALGILTLGMGTAGAKLVLTDKFIELDGQKFYPAPVGAYDAIVMKDDANVWAEDRFGRKIAEGEAGVDDADVIQSVIQKTGSNSTIAVVDNLYLTQPVYIENLFDFTLKIYKPLTIATGIGKGIIIKNSRNIHCLIKIDGEGQWGDDAIYIESTVGLYLDIYAKNYNGTVVHDVIYKESYESYEHIFRTFRTLNCARSLYVEKLGTINQGGYGAIIEAWWFEETIGSEISGIFDLTIHHLETLYKGTGTNLYIHDAGSIHLNTIALGEGDCILLKLENVSTLSIKKAHLVKPRVGLYIKGCSNLNLDYINVEGQSSAVTESYGVYINGGDTNYTSGISYSYLNIHAHELTYGVYMNNAYRTTITGKIFNNRRTGLFLDTYTYRVYIEDIEIVDNNLDNVPTEYQLKINSNKIVFIDGYDIDGANGTYLVSILYPSNVVFTTKGFIGTKVTRFDNPPCLIGFTGLSNSGIATITGDGVTQTFTVDIAHGLVSDKVVAKITLDRDGTIDKQYLVDADGDGFKETLRVQVTFATAPADGDVVPIYWYAEVVQ